MSDKNIVDFECLADYLNIQQYPHQAVAIEYLIKKLPLDVLQQIADKLPINEQLKFTKLWRCVGNKSEPVIAEQPLHPDYTSSDHRVQVQFNCLYGYRKGEFNFESEVVKFIAVGDRGVRHSPFSAAYATYLRWLQDVTGYQPLENIEDYFKKLLFMGDEADHDTQINALVSYGFRAKWLTDGDLNFVTNLVIAGFPVIVDINVFSHETPPIGGLLVTLVNYTNNIFTAYDPRPVGPRSNNGNNSSEIRMHVNQFKTRWLGGYCILA